MSSIHLLHRLFIYGLLLAVSCIGARGSQKGLGVAFRVVHTLDYSRPYAGRLGRPIQIAIWYPSETRGPRMKLSDYVDLYLTEEGSVPSTEKARNENMSVWAKELESRTDSGTSGTAILNSEVKAVRDAPIAKGQHPVIIYGAGGQGESFENSVMFEELASSGYIVLSCPSAGPFFHKTTIDAAGLEAATRDMEFLIAEARKIPEADLTRIGVIGWSWGGLAAVLLQMRNPVVDAVVSLDGSIAMHPDKLQANPFYDPQRVRVPTMFMSTSDNVPRAEEFLSQIKYSERFILNLKEASHIDFSSYGYIARKNAAVPTGEDIRKIRIYEQVINYTNRFFDAHLKADGSAREFAASVAASDWITRRAPLPLPPTQQEFFDIIRNDGIETARKVFAEVLKHDPNYLLFEPFEMTVLADQLYKAGRQELAIEAAKLRVALYPADYLSYEWVANLLYRRKAWIDALHYYGVAYGMLKSIGQKASADELLWYEKRLAAVRDNIKATALEKVRGR
jgi:pimeloyl-ACP methyl ester carboxylesterase